MTRYFITASGTEIGKTFVTALLVRQLRAAGRTVRALKPVISDYTRETKPQSDSAVLLAAMNIPATDAAIGAISPWQFEAPLAPDMAARLEGRELALDDIVGFCKSEISAAEDIILIEGVGGVMVPLNDTQTVRDWMTVLEIPAILVVGSYLGTISHTLTAVETLQNSGVDITGIIVSETPDSGVPLHDTVDAIARFAGTVPVIALPRVADIAHAPDLLGPLQIGE